MSREVFFGRLRNFAPYTLSTLALAAANAESASAMSTVALKPAIPICVAEHPKAWSPIPPSFTNPNFPKRLGVSRERFLAGKIALAVCSETIPFRKIKIGEPVKVIGEMDRCLAVGAAFGPHQPTTLAPDARFSRVAVVCPAPRRR